MNDLNSLLIEGELAEDVWFGENKDGEKLAQVFLYSRRYFTYERDTEMEQTTVKIIAERNLAEKIKGLKKGRRIRAVGRLRNERCMTGSHEVNWVVVCAEHIEIKPSYKSRENMDAIKIEQAKSDYQKIVSFIEDGSPLPPETDPYWEACAALDRLGGFIADIEGAKNTEQLLRPDRRQS